MTNTEFIVKLANAIGEDFCYKDMIFQEDLFKRQERITKLICEASNSGNGLAKIFVRKWDSVFKTEEVKDPYPRVDDTPLNK